VTLIIDAAPLVALGDSRDPLHSRVGDVLRGEPGELVVPAPVSAEADYLIRHRGTAQAARAFLRDVAAGRFLVEGLADASVVILARRFRTTRLLSFDERDFRAVTPLAGGHFTLLPRDENHR
jgi:predicted nucleic acid-binding protein